MPATPVDDQSPHPVPATPELVHAELEQLLRNRHHMGVRNMIGDVALEPRNPFQSQARRAKKWLVATLGILLLGLLIVYFFHWR